MKKIVLLASALLLGLTACVQDPIWVNPEGDVPPPPPTPAVVGSVVFNELDCQNKKIELYNITDAPIDMTGWTMTKDDTEWEIPASRGLIPAKGFAVFTGKSDGVSDPTFGLSGTKGFVLILKDATAQEINKVENAASSAGGVEIADGKSWGRTVDGGDTWVLFDTPTIGASNNGAVEPEIKIYINEISCGDKKIEIYNASTVAVDIAGYLLIKDGDASTAWTVPTGMGDIAAGGFIVYTAKQSDPANGPTFGISGTKGFKITLAHNAEPVDEIDNSKKIGDEDNPNWKEVADTETLGRKTDGAAEWVLFSAGTLGSSNNNGTIK